MAIPHQTRTRSKGASGAAFAARLAVLLVVAAITLTLVLFTRSPLTINVEEVRRMLASGELIGLPVEEAASRLHHAPPTPPVIEGTVLLEFRHIRGWRAAGVELEVRGGRITSADWESTAPRTTPR